jgi:hypothetical protein
MRRLLATQAGYTGVAATKDPWADDVHIMRAPARPPFNGYRSRCPHRPARVDGADAGPPGRVREQPRGSIGAMPAKRRTDVAAGRAALDAWRAGQGGDRPTVATAVRYTLEELATRAPGHTLEVRVPPFGVTQCVEGPRHTRGTPPNVVETDAETWLSLVVGRLSWTDARSGGRVRASGERADLHAWLPLLP